MKTYLVGGAVRDRLLNIKPSELDWVVVGATTEQMLARGFRRVGRDFPVFIDPATGDQHALARRERKSGHGYAGFEFDTGEHVSLEDDLGRRDLTINAMAENENKQLIDPHGGQADLAKKLLRHVSPAFVEDPLRVLRVARFAARFHRLGFTVAPETMELMREIVASGEIDHLVAERVWEETRRALGEADPQQYLVVLRECGALARVFPEIEALFGVPQPERHHPEIDTGVHLLLCLQMSAQMQLPPIARFAVLTHDLGKALTPPEQWPSHIRHETLGARAVRAVCERLKVPVKWRELALLVCLHHTRCHRALEMRAPALVRLIEELDAVRNEERFELFLGACEADARGRTGLETQPYPQAERLRLVRTAAASVTSESARAKGLEGPQIGAEMHRLRCIAVDDALAQQDKP